MWPLLQARAPHRRQRYKPTTQHVLAQLPDTRHAPGSLVQLRFSASLQRVAMILHRGFRVELQGMPAHRPARSGRWTSPPARRPAPHTLPAAGCPGPRGRGAAGTGAPANIRNITPFPRPAVTQHLERPGMPRLLRPRCHAHRIVLCSKAATRLSCLMHMMQAPHAPNKKGTGGCVEA